MNTSSKQTTLKAGNASNMHSSAFRKAPITSMGLITILLAFSSASALTVQRPRAMRSMNTNSNDSFATMRTQSSKPATTKLLYAHGDFADDEYRRDEHNTAVHGMKTRMTTIWSNIFPAQKPESEQEVVDEYLQFLDKRYHRLHDEEETIAPSKQFSVLGWLSDTSGSDPVESKNHDDALFVLGVAELASEELLQKHQISVEAVSADTVIDTEASTISREQSKYNGLFGAVPSSTKPPTSILQKIKGGRRSLIIYQEKQMKRAFTASIRTAITAPSRIANTAKAVWVHGGGKNTIALSVSMLTAAFFLLSAVAGMVFESGITEA